MNTKAKNQHDALRDKSFPKSSDWPLYIRWWRGVQICLTAGIVYQLLVWWGDLMGWLGVKQWLTDKALLQSSLLFITALLLIVGLPILIHAVAFATVARPNFRNELTSPNSFFKNVDLKNSDKA